MLQLWRIAPDEEGTLRPELLEEHPNLGSQVTYMDGYWRGVYMDMGKLLWVDMAAGTQIELIRDDVRAFSVLD